MYTVIWFQVFQSITYNMNTVIWFQVFQSITNNMNTFTSPALDGPSGIRAGWGIKINSRFEAERPPALAGPLSGWQAATLIPLSPMH